MARAIKTASDSMTREQLEVADIEAGVAKWGEGERAGLTRLARKKHIDTLRVEYDLRHIDEQTALAASAYRVRNDAQQYQAAHCNEDGPT